MSAPHRDRRRAKPGTRQQSRKFPEGSRIRLDELRKSTEEFGLYDGSPRRHC